MNRTEYEESRNKTYKIIKDARTEIEKIQFNEGLHNDITESVKQTLIDMENDLLNYRIRKPSTRETIEKY